MTTSRRDFIKFVVAGSVVGGCPVDLSLLVAPASSAPQVNGEQFEICHQVRDGHVFAPAAVSRRYDVAIVGGGVSGLAAAYFLQKYNFLLVEKEVHWGGTAYIEEFESQAYGTGSAFDFAGSASDLLARELGLTQLPINNPDSTIVQGVFVEDTWRKGLDHLPFPPAVRSSFKKFRDVLLKIDTEKNRKLLDNESFAKYFAGHAPEVQQWWDCYGPSNWGASAKNTSALVGIEALQDMAGDVADKRVTSPGGLGAITKRLTEVLLPKHRERMHGAATVVAVAPQKNEVHVTYLREGKLKTIAAKAVIMATPKFNTSSIVSGIPEAQHAAMRKLRYAPYPVVNLIFDRPVYNRGYDTWAPGKRFTDFIVADWVVRNQPGYKQKHNILTCYTPLREEERARLLTEEASRKLAAAVLRDFQGLLPEFNVAPIEAHIYRRGHPMFMALPGTYTVTIPAARRPMKRIFFANTDSEGPESLTAGGVIAAQRGAEWAENVLADKPVIPTAV